MYINKLPPPPRFRILSDRKALTRRSAALGKLLTFVLLLAQAQVGLAQQQHSLPLVKPDGSTQQGFLRIINRSDHAGTVRIDAIDDSGERFGPATLSLSAMATAHLSSKDLEDGNAGKGLPVGVGDGEGDWRLELTTELDIEPLAYIRTPDGFVTSVHDVVEAEFAPASTPGGDDSILYHVRFFNPGRNTRQQSRLRLINTSGTENVVTITGLDDAGRSPPGRDVRVTMPAYTARTITAQELEQGDADFEGSFGVGKGKWRLLVSAEGTVYGHTRPIQVVSLLNSSGTGNLTNLSTSGSGNDPNRGDDGVDYITGGGGDDVLNPGDNDDAYDVVFGSDGNDRIVYSDSGPTAYQALNYSSLSTGVRATINGISNVATVSKGAAGTDTIVDIANPLNASKQPPYGGFGIGGSPFDDTFTLTLEQSTDEGSQWMEVRGDAGNDRIDIRSGHVAINYRTSTEGIDVDLADGRASNDGFGGVDTIIGDVRELIGGDSDDTIRGTDGQDRLDGGAGDDVLDPRDAYRGVDNVFASVGNDRIIYSDSGADAYQSLWYSRPWREARTALDETGITVTLNGATNRATVSKGSAGTDTLVDISNPLDAGWTNGGLGIHGTKGEDVFNLTLDREQWMQVEGGPGDDSFNLRSHRWDPVSGDGSIIRVTYDNSPSGIDIDLRARTARNDGFGDVDTFTFNDSYFEIRGSDFSDMIRGSDNDDRFVGSAGNDFIDGRGGTDRLHFDRIGMGGVVVDLSDHWATGTWHGKAFSYRIRNIERVRGSLNDDQLTGTDGDDRLEGHGGDDWLIGLEGNDKLYGGEGSDTFFFYLGDGHDRIYDFDDEDDGIALIGLGIMSKQDVLDRAYAWDEGIGVRIDLTSFGGGRIDLHGFDRDDFDASDFVI